MKCTRAEIAAIFGVMPPAVDGWVRRGCPVAEPSQGRGRGKGAKFWAPDVVKWRDEHGGGGGGWGRRGGPVAEPSQGRGRGKGAKFWAPDVVKWRDEHVVGGGAEES